MNKKEYIHGQVPSLGAAQYRAETETCLICKKVFRPTTEWVYRRTYRIDGHKARYYYFCSYSCLRSFDKKKEREKAKNAK